MRTIKRIAVYCGSSNHVDPAYFKLAEQMGKALSRKGIGLVYGGGRVGLMGRLADSVMAEGGEVLGVIPHHLQTLEVGHEDITELFVVRGMQPRKSLMINLADAFIALPGGFGTLEELFEVITLGTLNYQDKPVGILNGLGFFDQLLDFLDSATAKGFIRQPQRDHVLVSDDPNQLIEDLLGAELADVRSWIEKPSDA